MEINTRTSPAQKISLGHQGCTGGSATCDGKAWLEEPVGLATAVDNVMDGTPVLTPGGLVTEGLA